MSLARLSPWLWRALRATLLYSALLLMLAVGMLLFSEVAPRWLWQQTRTALPSLTIEAISGTVAGGLRVQTLSWRNDALAIRANDLALSLSFTELLSGRFALDTLQARQFNISSLKASEPSILTPPSISLPIPWALKQVSVDRLQWSALGAEPVVITALAAMVQGQGSDIQLPSLSGAYGDWYMAADAQLALREQWPLQAKITLRSDVLAPQRIDMSGDLSALNIRSRGPANYPLALDVSVNVLLPTLPFRGRLAWPLWQPPGQADWRLAAGAMTFAGSTEQGELALALQANLLEDAALAWPKKVPRRAQLAGPLRWHTQDGQRRAELNWQGKLGNAPWHLAGHYDQAALAKSVLNMAVADARLSIAGWPASGLRASINVPVLQRFQRQFRGALQASGQWQGAWLDGHGRLQARLRNFGQDALLINDATLMLAGRITQHQLALTVASKPAQLTLRASGGLSPSNRWRGKLTEVTVTPAQGRWQLMRAADLQLSAQKSHLAQACWQQTARQLSPWQVCTEADLTPHQWLATLTAEAPQGGMLRANLRRDPQASAAALDADIRWQAINLAAIPVALPEGLAFQGHSDGSVRISGSLEQPMLSGQWHVAASLGWPRYGLSWPSIVADGQLTGRSSRWQAAIRDSSDGQLSLTGDASWQPDILVQMQLRGQQLAFAYAPWVTGSVSPSMVLSWQQQRLSIEGELLVDKADITLKSLAASAPKPSADVVVVRDRQGRLLALSEQPAGLPLSMHMRVLLGERVTLSGYGLDAGLRGQLLLTQSPNTALAATGEISLKPNAQFAAYGQRLNIAQGRLLFTGPLNTPDIRLNASREVDGVTVGVNVIGQAPKPSVTLTSDSPLSQDEILSYLVLGRSLGNNAEPSAADKQALALSAALNLTGKTGAIGVLGQRLGISDFAIATQGSSDATEVAVSGRLSPKLWLSIGRGVFQPSQSVTVRYQINRRLSLEALSALESAITLFYSWRF